jgi:serine protease Do
MRWFFAVSGMFFLLATGVALADAPDFVALSKKAGPAVVNISTEKKVSVSPGGLPRDFFKGLPPGFEEFFEQFGPRNNSPRSRTQRALGTGFVISDDGYVVTNNHVVTGADTVYVNFMGAEGREDSIVAEVIGADAETDLALLKVSETRKLPYVSFGDSDALEVGEWVLAIGNPFGLGHTVTAGIVSAKGRNIQSGPFDNFLQTDASINPGNSGGPLINKSGEVVGINTAIIGNAQGIGFAIPSNMAAQIIDQLKSNKRVSRGWMGVNIQELDANTAKALGVPSEKGVLVSGVKPGEPADKAGIKDGDVIVRVNATRIDDTAALLRSIASFAPGTKVRVGIIRNGQTLELNVTLAERNVDGQARAPETGGDKSSAGLLGIAVRALTADESRARNLAQGTGLLVIEAEPGKPAAEHDIRKDDVILTANLKPVGSTEALAEIINTEGKQRGALTFQIQRQGQTFFRTIPLNEQEREGTKP